MGMQHLIKPITHLPSIPVKIREQEYSVLFDGKGKLPVFSIGIGSHMQMTLSGKIKELISLYSTDLYWIESKKLKNPETLSMDELVADFIAVLDQLKLRDCLVIGFSCYGILALELAKKIGSRIKGVILVSTPPAWNDEVIQQAQEYFDKNASEERKYNDTNRKEHFAKIRTSKESIVSINAYEADAARYWRDFSISREVLELLWQGIQCDDKMMNHFFSHLLPKHQLELGIEKINIPVILFAGQMDFDSIPSVLWKSYPKPPNFKVIDCGKTGHWPNLENPTLFDAEFLKFISSID
jgi:pimeloyl-ACP methyl ester carboxylesterase